MGSQDQKADDPIRVSARGVGLAVFIGGRPDAPPVVVLHGFTGSAASMEGVSAGLRDEFRVHAIDLVGHGESDAPDDVALYSMDACVAQVIAVLDAVGIARAHFIGYSMGGRVALSLAASEPGRVGSLVLVGVSPGERDPAARAQRMEADDALARGILDRGVEAFVDDWMALPLFASQRRLGEEALALARRQRLTCRPLGLANSLRGMGSGAMPALTERLGEIDRPVLLVVGAEDSKFSAVADAMLPAFPQAELIEIAEAGHAAHLEQPQVFQAVCQDFLRSVIRAEARSDGERRATPPPTETRPSPGEKRLP